jgi:hypothetical protein
LEDIGDSRWTFISDQQKVICYFNIYLDKYVFNMILICCNIYIVQYVS